MDGDSFLSMVSREYLTGTAQEKQMMIDNVDLLKLEEDTFALIVKHLKRKGHFKERKGFGT